MERANNMPMQSPIDDGDTPRDWSTALPFGKSQTALPLSQSGNVTLSQISISPAL